MHKLWTEGTMFRVVKTADHRTGEVNLDIPKMYGQFATPFVFSDKLQDIIKSKMPMKDKEIAASEVPYEERKIPLYQKDIAIDFPVYFSSCKLGAGWFQTSGVKSFEIKDNGDFILDTYNSIYYCTMEKE